MLLHSQHLNTEAHEEECSWSQVAGGGGLHFFWHGSASDCVSPVGMLRQVLEEVQEVSRSRNLKWWW